jgi:hypothetical protein
MNETESGAGQIVTSTSGSYRLLWGIAIASLLMNLLLLGGLWLFQREARTQITAVTKSLEGVRLDHMTIDLAIDETIPLDLTVPFSDTFQVPLSMTVPIETSFRLQDTINVPLDEVVSIDRDVTVNLSILGQRVPVNIPIRADVPIRLDADIPLDLEVPVSAEVPLNIVVDVPVNTELALDTAVPVQLDIPVVLPLGDLRLNDFLNELRELGERLGGK